MSTRLEIGVGEKRDVLVVPVNAVFDRAGVAVCHRVGLFGSQTHRVELGESDDVFVEIRSGLREGQRVALLDVSGAGTQPTPSEDTLGFRPRLLAQPAGAPPLAPR